MRTKRIDEIELYIREKKSVSLDTLCEVFDVSKNTIRRHSCIKDFASFFQTPSKFYEREATNQPVSCISCL